MKKIIGINLIIFFGIFILLEPISRFFNLAGLMGHSQNTYINKGKNLHALKADNEGKIFNSKYYTDKYGYRVPKPNFNYSKDKKSIFFIGDSVTFGNGVLEQNTFVGKLRKEFKSLNFINSSVPGYNIPQFTQILETINNFEEVTKIFYIYCLNDISGINQEQEVNTERKKINKIKQIKIANKLNVFLRDKSVFYMFLKGALTDPSERYFKYEYNAYKVKSNINLLENFLTKVKDETIQKNIEFKIIIIPYEFQTRNNNCANKFMNPQRMVTKIIKKMDIQFSDYSEYFCNHADPNKLYYKYDPAHLSRDGHNLVFSILKKDI